jgi:hypothetical protein
MNQMRNSPTLLEKIINTSKRYTTKTLLATAVTLSSYGCSPSPATNSDDNNDIIGIPNNTASVLEDGVMSIDDESTQIEPGSIIYGYDQNDLPFLRKVEESTVENGDLILETTQASLSEAIESGEGNFNENLNFSSDRTPSGTSPYVNIIDNSKITAGGKFDWEYDLNVSGYIDIGAFKLNEFELDASGSLEAKIDLDGSNQDIVIPNAYAHKIALDPATQKIFWTEGPDILKADYDGSGVETIVNYDHYPGYTPHITLDNYTSN